MVLTQITKKTTPCLRFLASLDPFWISHLSPHGYGINW